MTDLEVLAHSRALWNRKALDLRSDETLAQILDRGSMEDWRALYRLAKGEGLDLASARELRQRLFRVLTTVPLPLPYFWLAALESLSNPPQPIVPTPLLPPYPTEGDY